MGENDVMTMLLMRLLDIDPLNLPAPVRLLGFKRFARPAPVCFIDDVAGQRRRSGQVVIASDRPPSESRGKDRPTRLLAAL